MLLMNRKFPKADQNQNDRSVVLAFMAIFSSDEPFSSFTQADEIEETIQAFLYYTKVPSSSSFLPSSSFFPSPCFLILSEGIRIMARH
jgi:hypothetical protein